MGNCLVTKLKGSVDNDNLPKLGELKIELTTNTPYSEYDNVFVLNGSPMTVRSNKDMLGPNRANWGRSISFPAEAVNCYMHNCGEPQTLMFGNKYTIKSFTICNVYSILDLTDLNYMPKLTTLSLIGSRITFTGEVDIAKLNPSINAVPYIKGKTKNIESFVGSIVLLGSNMNAADIQAIPVNVTQLNIVEDGFNTDVLQSTNNPIARIEFRNINSVSGDFGKLGKFAALKYILGSNGGSYTMSLEDFVANKKAFGGVSQDSEGVVLSWLGRATFNGSNIRHIGNLSLTWTASGDNTVITFDGASTTIHINSDGTWTRVS